mmetsp:Transcript_20719/g.53528  ORF Transcript_20719/g.53528 Transcript_20719/m.53528 type:complete len:209 (-) Transcript_20719:2263-2889(-)
MRVTSTGSRRQAAGGWRQDGRRQAHVQLATQVATVGVAWVACLQPLPRVPSQRHPSRVRVRPHDRHWQLRVAISGIGHQQCRLRDQPIFDCSFFASASTSGESVTPAAFSMKDGTWSKLRYRYVSAAVASRSFMAAMYSSCVGSRPRIAATAASSADARYTLAPLPRRLGKLRVDVETTVELSATRAWLPMHSEQPGISVRAPTLPYV